MARGSRSGMGFRGVAQHHAHEASRASTFEPIQNARAAACFLRRDLAQLGAALPGCEAPRPLKGSLMPAGIPEARQDVETSRIREAMRVAIGSVGGKRKLAEVRRALEQVAASRCTEEEERAGKEGGGIEE